jgi:hypothetical protein
MNDPHDRPEQYALALLRAERYLCLENQRT